MKYELLCHKDVELLGEYIDSLEEEELNQYIYSKGYYDIEFYTDYFLSHWKKDKKTKTKIITPVFHKEIWESFNSKGDTCVVIPRDHAKTTAGKMYLMWNICYNVDESILLIMSEGLGATTIGVIREEFENNEDIINIYGNLVPSSRREEQSKSWTQKKLRFLNGVELFTLTKNSKSKRGNRPTLILVDDPQENEDVKNKAIADEFETNFFTSTYNMLDDSGRCIILGTVIGPNAFVEKIRQNPRGFNIIEYTAILNIKVKFLEEGRVYKLHGKPFIGDGKKHIIGGEPLWKEKWSLEALDRRYQKLLGADGKDDDKFFQEYMNEALVLGGRTFYSKGLVRDIVEVKPISIDDIFKDLKIFKEAEFNCLIGCDVAEGLLNGDYTTIRVRSRKDYSILASYRGHIHPFDLPKVFKRLFDLGYIGRIGIERNNHGLTVLKGIIDDKEHQIYSSYLYFEQVQDKITQKYSDKPGWGTTSKSRPLMLDEHNKLFERRLLEVDYECKNEMLTFYVNERGKPEAPNPYHDDIIIADAICIQMEKYPIYRGVKFK